MLYPYLIATVCQQQPDEQKLESICRNSSDSGCSAEHDVQVQPPGVVIHAFSLVALLRHSGTVNGDARSQSLPLRRSGCEKLCMGGLKATAADGVLVRAGKVNLRLHGRQEEHALGSFHIVAVLTGFMERLNVAMP